MGDHHLPITVIKVGGDAALDRKRMASLFSAIRSLRIDNSVVIVHGGGSLATQLAKELGYPPQIEQGRRITTERDLRCILWAVRGETNSVLVGHAYRAGIRAIGISGADSGLVRVTRRPPVDLEGRVVDFGHVGDIEEIDPSIVLDILENGYLPVVATLGIGANGDVFNVNADTVATRIASAIHATTLWFVTPAGGLRGDAIDPSSQRSTCTAEEVRAGVEDGWIDGGMRVKAECALYCLEHGVDRVFIGSETLDPTASTRFIADAADAST